MLFLVPRYNCSTEVLKWWGKQNFSFSHALSRTQYSLRPKVPQPNSSFFFFFFFWVRWQYQLLDIRGPACTHCSSARPALRPPWRRILLWRTSPLFRLLSAGWLLSLKSTINSLRCTHFYAICAIYEATGWKQIAFLTVPPSQTDDKISGLRVKICKSEGRGRRTGLL